MIAEREALRKGIEHLTVLFPTAVSSFDFQVENSGRTVQYKLNAQSLRLFGLHSDVNDAHRAGANRLQNKTKCLFPTARFSVWSTCSLARVDSLSLSSRQQHCFSCLLFVTRLHFHDRVLQIPVFHADLFYFSTSRCSAFALAVDESVSRMM